MAHFSRCHSTLDDAFKKATDGSDEPVHDIINAATDLVESTPIFG